MPRIVFVADTENNRILVKRRLEKNGFQVLAAENAEEGLARARAEMPDLILMDMGSPGIDGWSAPRQLKADPKLKGIPVIAVTAHAMQGDREKALDAGCDEYETKPFDFARLIEKIQTLLASRGPAEAQSLE